MGINGVGRAGGTKWWLVLGIAYDQPTRLPPANQCGPRMTRAFVDLLGRDQHGEPVPAERFLSRYRARSLELRQLAECDSTGSPH